MKKEVNENTNKTGSTIGQEQGYEPSEFAELINQQPDKLLDTDLVQVTRGYDILYIDELLINIESESTAQILINYIKAGYEKEVAHHNKYVCTYDKEKKQWVENNDDFLNQLTDIQSNLKIKREKDRAWEKARKQWADYCMTQTTPPCFSETYDHSSAVPAVNTLEQQYPLRSQPSEVQNKLRIFSAKVYAKLADIIVTEIKPWVDQRSIKDWNVLRYVLRKHKIFVDNTSYPIFADFLNTILRLDGKDALKPDTISSREDAKIDIQQTQMSLKLSQDSEELEKMLEPVFEMMYPKSAKPSAN